MTTWARIGAFVAAAAVVFAIAFGIGRATGPDADIVDHTPTPTGTVEPGQPHPGGHS